jgi:hypothetical protein
MEWIDHLDLDAVAPSRSPDGPWGGISYRWLNRNRLTGGGAVLLDLPPGWEGEGTRSGALTEEFVLVGSLVTGLGALDTWGYACRADGRGAGRYTTSTGALLFCWWERDEFVN